MTAADGDLAPSFTYPIDVSGPHKMCAHGHALTDDNCTPWGLRQGKRECLRCERDRKQEHNSLLRIARTGLGFRLATYGKIFGYSRKTAESVIEALTLGLSKEDIISMYSKKKEQEAAS